MNESLQQALAGILNKTMAGVEAGVSFLSAELPDVIHQLLLWKMVSAGVFALLSIAAVVFFTGAAKRGIKVLCDHSAAQSAYIHDTGEKEREARSIMEDLSSKIPFAIGAIALAVLSWLSLLIGGIPSAMEMLKIWLAPKIYLIEYAASLAK